MWGCADEYAGHPLPQSQWRNAPSVHVADDLFIFICLFELSFILRDGQCNLTLWMLPHSIPHGHKNNILHTILFARRNDSWFW